jgi:uncharacterized membrane protein YhaH (DUF805 family)
MPARISFIATYRQGLRFSGRSSRSELLSYVLAWLLISVPVSFVTGLALVREQHLLVTNALAIVLALPVPALLVRRFHDHGRGGHWVWLAIAVFAVWLIRTAIAMAWGVDRRIAFDAWTWALDWLIVVSNAVTLLLIVHPGDPGPNRFGANPRTPDVPAMAD